MHHVPLALQCIYGRSAEGVENGDGEEGLDFRKREKNGDCLISCMQMTWFCVKIQKKT